MARIAKLGDRDIFREDISLDKTDGLFSVVHPTLFLITRKKNCKLVIFPLLLPAIQSPGIFSIYSENISTVFCIIKVLIQACTSKILLHSHMCAIKSGVVYQPS